MTFCCGQLKSLKTFLHCQLLLLIHDVCMCMDIIYLGFVFFGVDYILGYLRDGIGLKDEIPGLQSNTSFCC